jgi:hypothetical protein
MALTTYEKAEMKYWYSVVYEYMCKQADWRYPEDATEGLLLNKFNQSYITDDIEWPVMRWRQLNAKLPESEKLK